MQNIKYLIYISFGFLLVSCGEDFFDSITEIEVPEHEPQFAVRGFINATYLEYGSWVRVGHTLGILDSTEFEEIKDATVLLYEEDVLKNTFEYAENAWYTGEITALTAGKNYTLKVDSPTYGSIEVTQQVPQKVSVINATYEAAGAIDRYGDRGDEVTIQFNDPAGEKNYYTVGVSATFRFEGPDTSFVVDNWGLYASPVDPLLEHLNSLYLTDVSFDGDAYTTRVSIEIDQAGTIEYLGAKNLAAEKITVRLTSISKDWYLFQKTLSAFQDNEGNPFAEPVVIHENIEGGTGIFGLSITDEFPVEL